MKEAMKKKILASLLVFAMILQIGIGLPVIYADTTATAGAFTVTGGSIDKDYAYENNTLTVKTSTPLTISGTTESDNIEVADGVKANVTLNNTNIDVSSKAETSAFAILDSASCNLTIEGINSLKSGVHEAGLQVESKDGKTASVVIDGTGSLITAGNAYGAGIGGGYGGNGGTITVNSGTITATGGNFGAGIGGGYGSSGGTFSTSPTGHAFIVASSISDTSNKVNWKGVIFNGTSGEVYGDAIQLTTSAEIPTANTLTIDSGKTLTISKSVTLTNKGTIVNNGTIRNSGIYHNDGILDGNAIIKVNTTTTKVSLQPANVTYGEDTAVKADITPTSTATNKGNVDFYLGDESSGIKLNTNPIPVDEKSQTANLKITKDVLVTSGATLKIGDNMITAVYHGTTDLQESSGTGILTVNKASQAAPELTSTAETISGKADGKISGLTTAMEYNNIKDGDYTAVIDTNMNFAAGTYYVRYRADTNHEASAPAIVTINKGKMLKLTLPTNQEGYTLTADKIEMNWHDSVKLTFSLKEGFSKTADFAAKVNGTQVTLTDNGTYTIADNEKDVTITVEGVKDITPPTGIITLGKNRWNTILNKITFGLFFKDTQSVNISGEDTGSGIANIEYYIADSKVDNLNDIAWTKGKTFSLNPDNKVVIYARITDKAGNIMIINSEGLVFYNEVSITPETAKIDSDMPEDIHIGLGLNDNTLKEIKKRAAILTSGIDYIINEDEVILKKGYLEKVKKEGGDVY